jgi:hypothetical protein
VSKTKTQQKQNKNTTKHNKTSLKDKTNQNTQMHSKSNQAVTILLCFGFDKWTP